MIVDDPQFEQRKQDHLRIAMYPTVQAHGLSGLDDIQLVHEALPNVNFSDIDLHNWETSLENLREKLRENLLPHFPDDHPRNLSGLMQGNLPENSSRSLKSGLTPRKKQIGLVDSIESNESVVNSKTSNHSFKLPLPIFISSMTAGNEMGRRVNLALARLSDRQQILMGLGSQRRELWDLGASQEWKELRKQAPNAQLVSNIGISQLYDKKNVDQIPRIIEAAASGGLFIHLNALQECLQPEGEALFQDSMKTIEAVVKRVEVPVIVKETGCGFSEDTLRRLKDIGLHAVDVSGLGGTHWGRVEGFRAPEAGIHRRVAETFADWGISTVDSVISATDVHPDYEIWASGGVRTGLDVVKLLSLGAQRVGMAKSFLEVALQEGDTDKNLDHFLQVVLYEIRVALFCIGCKNLAEIRTKKGIWKWRHQTKLQKTPQKSEQN